MKASKKVWDDRDKFFQEQKVSADLVQQERVKKAIACAAHAGTQTGFDSLVGSFEHLKQMRPELHDTIITAIQSLRATCPGPLFGAICAAIELVCVSDAYDTNSGEGIPVYAEVRCSLMNSNVVKVKVAAFVPEFYEDASLEDRTKLLATSIMAPLAKSLVTKYRCSLEQLLDDTLQATLNTSVGKGPK